jgi:hypothetical protein
LAVSTIHIFQQFSYIRQNMIIIHYKLKRTVVYECKEIFGKV